MAGPCGPEIARHRERSGGAAVFLHEGRTHATRLLELIASAGHMTTDNAFLRHARGPVAPPMLRANARIYASPTVMELLTELAAAPRIAVCVDVDALQRTTLATVDRIMRCALNALCHLHVQVILVAHHERERAALLHDALSHAWCVENPHPASTLAQLHARLPDIALIGITDDPDLLEALAEHDRGIALGNRYAGTRTNIAAAADLTVRAALWWLVDVRWKAGMVALEMPATTTTPLDRSSEGHSG